MVRFLAQREQQGDDGRARDRQRRIAESGDEAEAERAHGRGRRGCVGLLREVGAVRITDGEDGRRAGDNRSGGERLPCAADEPGEARHQAKQGEGAHTGDARACTLVAQLETALNPDQQPAGQGGRDRQRLPVPGGVQLSRSECQRRWSAMNVEMK